MSVRTGKHTKEEGPVKSILSGTGVVITIGGLGLLFGNGDAAGVIWIIIGGAVIWLASKIRDRNVLRW